VGWVSILKLPQLRKLLGIPAHIVPVAYLCLGYPVEFQDRPLLEAVGWRQRIPLEELLHFDNWQDQSPDDATWPGLDQALKLEAEDYKLAKPSQQPT
jgi:5,6-dimethylbenzimidazole synthase